MKPVEIVALSILAVTCFAFVFQFARWVRQDKENWRLFWADLAAKDKRERDEFAARDEWRTGVPPRRPRA